VLPGERVAIPLKVYGRRGALIEYRLRTAPRAGRIVESRQVRPDEGELIYEAPTRMPDNADLNEELTFVARDSSGSSAPALVKITVVNEPPEVTMAEEVAFGEILAGSPAAREITLRNPGHRLVEGEIEVSPPWTVAPAHYHLRAGESVSVRIGLTPSQAQEYTGYLRLPSLGGKGSRLQAVAVGAVAAGPARIDLTGHPDHLRRTGTLTLANRTDQPRTVALTAAPRLGLPATVTLEARETREIALVIAENDLGAVEETIRIAQGSYLQEVQVRSLAVGPRLEVLSEGIAFGKVTVGHEAKSRLSVRNVGGATASVVTSAPAAFTVEPARFDLEPGVTREVEIRLEATKAGEITGEVGFAVAGSRTGIPVRGEALWAEAGAQPTWASRPSPQKTEAAPAPGKKGAAEGKAPHSGQALLNGLNPLRPPAIRTIKILELAPTRIDLAWPPVAESTGYRVEARQLSPGKEGGVETTWVPVTPVKLEPGTQEVRAAITGIPEGAAGTIRIVALGPGGKALDPSPPLSFALPRRPPLFTLHRMLLAGFTAILAAALWLKTGRSVFGLRVAG